MKKAIITGASSGLGHEIALALLKRKVKIINISREDSKLNVVNIKTDLTSNKEIEKAINFVLKNHRDADVLILCAGLMHWHYMGQNPAEEIDNDVAVNLTSQIKIVNGLIDIIKKNKGDIIIVGSTASFSCHPECSVYNASKHGVLGFIKSLQQDYKNEDLRIIGFYPGGFKSKFHINAKSKLKQEDLMDPKYLAQLVINSLELPRNMEVSEIVINRKNVK